MLTPKNVFIPITLFVPNGVVAVSASWGKHGGGTGHEEDCTDTGKHK